MTPEDRANFENAIGWSFEDDELLERALSHRSWCAEHPGDVSNERLEFLGDAVLGIVVTDYLCRNYEHLAEGELTKARASVVNAEVLATVAVDMCLGPCLRLSKGEDSSGGRTKSSILADSVEAVFAAVYLDGGLEVAQSVIIGLLSERIARAASGPGGDDYKTRLQECVAQRYERLPRYQISDDGPAHEKRFFATVLIDGEQFGAGEGASKQQAEQGAAREALQRLEAKTKTDLTVSTDAGESPALMIGVDGA